jgi:hypothetical protein
MGDGETQGRPTMARSDEKQGGAVYGAAREEEAQRRG